MVLIEEPILDKPFFEKALREGYNDEDIQILEIKQETVTTKGMNFLSDLFKATLKFTKRREKNGKLKEKQSIDILIKTEPTVAKEIVHQQELFITELEVYKNVLPKIEKLVNRKIGPRFFYGSGEARIIVMEDLTKKGFVIKDRQKGLPLSHCLLVLEQLARLHAGSVALYEKDPQLVSYFRHGILSSRCPDSYFRMMEVSLLNVSRGIRNWSDDRFAWAADKIEKLADTIRERSARVYDYEQNDFCVLNHGDCWINNIMFKENEKGEPCDLMMVDYQMSVYASPAIDLLYFLSICPEIKLKYHKDDYFLEVYLRTLRSSMKAAGCKTLPPTLEKLKEDMYKRRSYAVFAGLVLYLRMIANVEDTEDFDRVLNELAGETKMDVFKNPDAITAVKSMIPIMEQRGYLD